ncbi:MAG: hypothetical protein LW832_10825 [Parachlamydia sp.]|jgi:hypothetical protein|nr:hypothetical protein [Parachlamydia sp.]
MKLLSKTVITSILSTLVAASAMAQCPQGGCPWGSYNRNYGAPQGYQQGYNNQGAQNYESNVGGWDNTHSRGDYPYPYGGQTYYSDFEARGARSGMNQDVRQHVYSTDGQRLDQGNLNMRDQRIQTQGRNYGAPQDNTWSTTSGNMHRSQTTNANDIQNVNTPSNVNTQNPNAPR